jgi:protoheme IX farnesyltransferase
VAEALSFALLLIPVSLTPWALGLAGATYAVLAVALGLVYLGFSIRFARILRATTEDEGRRLARDLLKASILYLPLLIVALMFCVTAKR